MKTFVAPWRAGTSSRWNAHVEGSVTAAKLTATVLRTAISLKHRYTCNVAPPPPKHWPLRPQKRSTEGSRASAAKMTGIGAKVVWFPGRPGSRPPPWRRGLPPYRSAWVSATVSPACWPAPPTSPGGTGPGARGNRKKRPLSVPRLIFLPSQIVEIIVESLFLLGEPVGTLCWFSRKSSERSRFCNRIGPFLEKSRSCHSLPNHPQERLNREACDG